MSIVQTWTRHLPQLGRDTAYLLLAGPLHVAGFCLVIVLAAAGAATVILVIGLPVLAGALVLAGRLAAQARRAVGAVDGSAPVPIRYPRSSDGEGLMHRCLVVVGDPQRWMDVLWVVAAFPVAVVVWGLAVLWLSAAVGGLLAPVTELVLSEVGFEHATRLIAGLLGLRPVALWAVLAEVLLGLLCAATAPFVLRGLALLLSGQARAMLSWQGEAGRLRSSRAAVQRAEADTRRRLERDIHDGPQQRLVRLNMDLARARQRLSKDPQATDAILEESMTQTQSALDELRQLSRGIAPPVLVDQGLGAAVSEAATLSAVPVTLGEGISQLAGISRLPDYVSQVAYFVVSEALANVNKHSGASAAHVGARVEEDTLSIWVDDDGVGGASAAKGHGLAGLAQRLDGVDGTLSISSPPGGPTRVKAVIPCVS